MLKTILLSLVAITTLTLTPNAQVYAAASIGRIVHTYGPAWVQRGATREKAEKGSVVLRNDSIVTGKRGRVKIIMGDGSKVYIGAKSRVSLRKYSMRGSKLLNARIHMLWGKARFFVNKLTSIGSSFRVRTPTAVLGVRGTEFVVFVPPTLDMLDRNFDDITLDDIPAQPTRVVLTEGLVDVSFGDAEPSGQLLPGKTAEINAAGQVVIRDTSESDIELDKENGTQGNIPSEFDTGSNASDEGGIPSLQEDLGDDDTGVDMEDATGQVETTTEGSVNALQNLSDSTEVNINSTYVE